MGAASGSPRTKPPQITALPDRPDRPDRSAPAAFRPRLPVPANPLLGRDAELRQAVALLRDPETRLLTMTGPGGIGKTRLALAVAAELTAEDVFPHGVWYIPLAAITDPDLVPGAIARALAVRETTGLSAAEAVAVFLQDRQQTLRNTIAWPYDLLSRRTAPLSPVRRLRRRLHPRLRRTGRRGGQARRPLSPRRR